ncbi:hypothetical protein FAZ95_25895 [Trinickia violacea]|uniref:Uncharacterized protein n=1 Tax=Trinickia violacea TaxID=2571746 RepID=A0A4P8J2H0_9BURK|nr:hypothetical protein [Trinickia violacea]QCP52589.1 hypothetical protein FAZ95_25895 [Trinickia violacea]
MHTCPLLRIALDVRRERNPVRGGAASTLYVFAASMAERLGWHSLEQLLAAIPDSNDDFAA